MTETWKAIPGYEGLYEVSNLGRVKSLDYNHTGKDGILKPENSTHGGYLRVHLCKDGKTRNLRVHRLVAEAFLPNPNNLETVNHKDEVKTNNVVDNLEWMSQKDNNNYGTRNMRASETNINNLGVSKAVQMLDKQTGELLGTFSSIRVAERVTGISRYGICLCCRSKQKSAGGFLWQYS